MNQHIKRNLLEHVTLAGVIGELDAQRLVDKARRAREPPREEGHVQVILKAALVRKAKDGEESVSSPVDLGPRLALEAFLGEEVGGLSLDGSDTDPELYRVALTPF